MNAGFDIRQELSQVDNPLQNFGFWVILAYFFVAYSRILDMTVPSLHLPMIMAALMYMTSVVVGGIQRSFSSKQGLCYLALTFWMGFSIFFTPWKMNSVDTFLNQWMKTFPLFIAVVATVYRTKQAEQLVSLIAIALTCTCTIALLKGDVMSDGRLIIAGTKFGDPNDLALFCNLALTSWFSVWSRTPSWVKRAMMLPCIGLILLTLLKTGSRGGLIGLAVVFAYLFFRVSFSKKLAMAAAAVVIVIGLGVLAGGSMTRRLMTFTEAESASDAGTVGSTESRKYLLIQSLMVTLQNPLLGTGPGNFMFAENDNARNVGAAHGAWHQTHNMYTQISSETGFPGLFLYLAIMGLTWTTLNRIEKRLYRNHPDPERIHSTAFWLKAMFIGFAASGTFLSIAYQDVLPLLAALALVIERAVVMESFVAKQQAKAPDTTPRKTSNKPVYAMNRLRAATHRV